MSAKLAIALVTCLVTLALCQDQTLNFHCKDGEQLASISTSFDKSAGPNGTRSFNFECRAVPNVSKATCGSTKILTCNDAVEGCNPKNGQWLAGVDGLYVGSSFPLVTPYCCQDPNTVLTNCGNFTVLNFQTKGGNNSVPSGSALSGVRCALITDRSSLIYDGIVKVQSCSIGPGTNSAPPNFSSSGSSGSGSSGSNSANAPNCPASQCECNCTVSGKQCPGQAVTRVRRHTIIYDREKRQACQCVCACQTC